MTVIALAAIAAALAGCTPKTTATPETPPAATDNSRGSLAGAPQALTAPSYWRLTEIAGRPVAAPIEGEKVPSLVFEREGNRVRGFAGCNSFTGGCEYLAADRLRFSMMAATRMACPDMTVEDEFLKALATADSYHTDGKVLKLHRAGLAPLAVFEASSREPK